MATPLLTWRDAHQIQAFADGARYAKDAIGGATDMLREGGWMRIAQVSTDAQGWQPPHSDAGLLLHLRPLVRCKALKRKKTIQSQNNQPRRPHLTALNGARNRF